MKPNNALYNGETVPVKPSTAVLTEFTLNGWTQEKINHALSAKPWKEEEYINESPLEDYKGGVGYVFEWGHVIEKCSPPDEGTPCYFGIWEFCLDGMLSRAHRSGMHLVDLCDLCDEYRSYIDERSWPVSIIEGASMSCFSLMIMTEEDSVIPLLEIERARKWIATKFLVNVLPDLLDFLEDNIPCLEIQ